MPRPLVGLLSYWLSHNQPRPTRALAAVGLVSHSHWTLTLELALPSGPWVCPSALGLGFLEGEGRSHPGRAGRSQALPASASLLGGGPRAPRDLAWIV